MVPLAAAKKEFLLDRCIWHCGGKLKPVWYSRLNWAGHEDWQGHILHKKCWRDLKVDEDDD